MTNGQGFLQHVLGGITAFAQRHLAEQRLIQEKLAVFRDTIEQVVDASEPRIRLVGDYAEKLVDAVEAASYYVEGLIRQLPAPLTLSSRAWSVDPQVNAFFATVSDLRTVLSLSRRVHAFFATTQYAECFAFLLMAKREIETFGTALKGDMLVRDVPRTQVSFAEHHIVFPSASESELRRDLKQRMLIFLATRALENIHELRTRREALEEQRRQLQAQLRAFRGHERGLRPLLLSDDAGERRLANLEQRLEQTEGELVAARKALGTLDDYLSHVQQVLSQPEAYLTLHLTPIRLNRLGVKLDEHSPEPAATMTLAEFTSLEQQRVAALVRFTRGELAPVQDF